MSIGHGSGIIERAWTDAVVAFIKDHCWIDRSYNVPLAAGISKDAKTIYVDKAIPDTYDKYVAVHEYVEKRMLDAGMTYLPAHAIATAAEEACVADDKVDMNAYDAFWGKWEKVAAKHKLGDGTPPDLETKPYKES